MTTEQAVGTEIYIDKTTVDSFNRTISIKEFRALQGLTGAAFRFHHPKYGSVQYPATFRRSDETIGIHVEHHGVIRVPVEECNIMPRDRRSCRSIAAYSIWTNYLTVGSIISEFGARGTFHSMVTHIDDKQFNWVGINTKCYRDNGKLEFTGKASTSGLGKIERARLGQLRWDSLNINGQ